MLPYHYVGCYNPVPKLISVDFAKLEKKIFNSYLNYREIIKELWKFPERKKAKNTILAFCYGANKEKKQMILYHYIGYYNPEMKSWRIKEYIRRHKMTEQVEIIVKVNGVATPLYRISEQTLLTVRENGKPKEVPVARTGESNERRYLILKVPENIKNYAGKIVAINLKGNYVNGSWTLERERNTLMDSDCVFSYRNVKVIS